MNNPDTLQSRHCTSCESGTPALLPEQVDLLLKNVPDWKLVDDRRRIRREWKAKDFDAALQFVDRVGEVARNEDHHPDLHLTDYRDVAIELSTHSAGGLTENDFIMAAKINALPVDLKR
jgi:4a-hydroxytetrahydrobiopterin dehydratase